MIKKIFCAGLLSLLLSMPSALAAPTDGYEWPTMLIPMGQTAGVQITSKGLVVVGYTDMTNAVKSPAQQAGLLSGDFITHVNDKPVVGAANFQEFLQACGNQSCKLTLLRRGVTTQLQITPALDSETYKIGAWVRDSISGIGTLTFYDPESGVFGALGHGINDTNTKMLMPIANGTLLEAQVVDVRRGQAGEPGELKGAFEPLHTVGSLLKNSNSGLFGVLSTPVTYGMQSALPLAKFSEIQTGKAQMLSNVQDATVSSYDIEIVRIFDENVQNSRNFMIRVTDEALLAKTGGIVQGMSGSPIIQNGRFVGAVTHVLVSDPKRGYGIFIQNMLSEVYGTNSNEQPTVAIAA